MEKPAIFRKRYIPDEIVDISKDDLIYRDNSLIITRWNTIRPRKDISKGISYTFLDRGYKISRLYDGNGEFSYWYCDIIHVDFDKEHDKYVITDLLVDVKQTVDGKMEVLDMEEMADAFQEGIIGKDEIVEALKRLDSLLQLFYTGSFPPAVCLERKYWYED
jgi:predicted RNA-binding protein associated with RNAse of E/G family